MQNHSHSHQVLKSVGRVYVHVCLCHFHKPPSQAWARTLKGLWQWCGADPLDLRPNLSQNHPRTCCYLVGVCVFLLHTETQSLKDWTDDRGWTVREHCTLWLITEGCFIPTLTAYKWLECHSADGLIGCWMKLSSPNPLSVGFKWMPKLTWLPQNSKPKCPTNQNPRYEGNWYISIWCFNHSGEDKLSDTKGTGIEKQCLSK